MKHIHVVVLSAHRTEKFNKELKELGVVDILEKPVDKNRLFETMDAYLSKTVPNVVHN
jgi:response regulator of citrate/malate metabolism